MMKTSLFKAPLAAGLVLATITAAHAGAKDTPEDVMRAGEKAAAALKEMDEGLKVAQALAARMQERGFATQLLELAKKKDRKGLAELLRKENQTVEEIRVTRLTDFTMEVWVTINGKGYHLCIGDHCEHPSGKKSPIVFEQGTQ
jgi:hypothetical protein